MDQLIWYSIPGALCVSALWLLLPAVRCISDALVIGFAVVCGFILHQAFRALFELLGGWESRLRPVIRKISDEYACDAHKAFLIWEITFYSSDVDDAFRSHGRAAWHYVMSFFAIMLTAAMCVVVTLFSANSDRGLIAGAFLVIGGLFALKGIQTARSICSQECALFALKRAAFDKTNKAIGDTPEPD